jgi:hypothetical protein
MENDNWIQDFATSLGIDLSHLTTHHTDAASNIEASATVAANDLTTPLNNPITLDHNSLLHPSPIHEPHVWNQSIIRMESPQQSLSNSNDDTANSLNLDTLSSHHQYNPHQANDSIIIGNPQSAMTHWHLQQKPDSCAISIQQSGIEAITNQNLSESQLRIEAQMNGSYHQGTGTPMEKFGDLLASHTNVPVESHLGGTISEITQKIAQGEEVFVGVNAQTEWLPDRDSLLGQIAPNLFDPSKLAENPANHIVQVIGMEINPLDPQHSYVIVNDSGSPDGRGVEIPVEQFQQAMSASHGYIASTNMHGDRGSILGNNSAVSSIANENIHFGCEVTTYDHIVWIDGDKYGTYNGNTFYWNNDKLAGHWDCAKYHAYNHNGRDLGYAKTWNDAALLIYKQD